MSFSILPTGKPGSGNQTAPSVQSYQDTLRITSAGYEFGFAATAESHCIGIFPMTQPTGPDTLLSNLEMPEILAGVYALDTTLLSNGSFFNAVEFGGALAALPGLTIFKDDGVNVVLRLEDTLFPTEAAWYLVAVCTLSTPGTIATVDNIVDFVVVYMQARDITVISAAAVVGIDTATLDQALALAGHNIRLHSPQFIDGRPATRTLTGANKSLNYVTTPELEDPTSAVGAETTLNQQITLTPDNERKPLTDISQDV